MRIDVAKLPEGDSEYQLQDRPTYFQLTGDDFELDDLVHFDCRVFKSAREVIVRGVIRTSIQLTCSRCLEVFQHRIAAKVIADYQPASQQVLEEDCELDPGELNSYAYRNDEIDLRQLVRDHLTLEIPMQPLCVETCAGLCAQCGVNLNARSCACLPETVDPRLAILQRLKAQKN